MSVSHSSTDIVESSPTVRAGALHERAPRRRSQRNIAQTFNTGLISAIVIVISLIWAVPTIGLFVSSLRPAALINTSGWWTSLVPPWNFTLDNYMQVLQAQGLGQAFVNSLIISIPGTLIPTVIAAFGAYAFAWMKFPGRDWIFLIIVALLVIPLQLTLIPVLSIFTSLNISGSYLSIWLAHTAYGLPFSIYLLRNFFAELPGDLFESAFIDGASNLSVFIKIVLPLSGSAIASLVIFQFIWVWNDLLVALIFLGGDPTQAPLTVTVANLVNSYGTNYQVLTAAAFISIILPLIVFFSLQRYFVRGMLSGSVKG